MFRSCSVLGLLAFLCIPPANAQKNWQPQDLTRGASLRVKYERRVPGYLLAQLHAEGFPTKEKLLLSSWTLSSEEKADSAKPVTVVLNESGEVRRENGSEFGTAFSELGVGTTYVIGLATVDGRVRALVRVTPFPIVATAGSCKLFAEAVEPLGAAYRITAMGFAPNEELKITTASKKLSIESTGQTGADGSWQGSVKLMMDNKKTSQLKLSVAGKSCRVKLLLHRREPPIPPPLSIERRP